MRTKDDKPMMPAMENWHWLMRETLPHSRNATHRTDLARNALCEWSSFMSRRQTTSQRS